MDTNCHEVGAFSYNLFMESPLGILFLIGSLVLAMMISIALMFKILNLPIFQGIPKWLEYILLLLTCFVPFSALPLFDSVGLVRYFTWQEVDGTLYVNLQTWSCSRGGCIDYLKVVDEAGNIVGKELQAYSAFKGHYNKYAIVNGCQLIKRGETFSLVDMVSREVVTDLNAYFDQKYGAKQYKIQASSRKQLIEVEKMDGSIETIALKTLLPADYQPMVTEWQGVSEGFKYRLNTKERIKGLFRALEFKLPRSSASLVIHRSTPFGEEGDFLLSAFDTQTSAKPKSTYQLSEVLDGETDFKIFVSEGTKEQDIFLWILRQEHSLSRLILERASGEVKCTQLIF